MDPLEVGSILFGAKYLPTGRQQTLYSNPSAHGFSSVEVTEELVDATLVLALAQVIDLPNPDRVYHEVFLFFPTAQKSLVVSRIHNLAKVTMDRLRPILNEKRGQLAIAHVRKWLEVLQLGPVENWRNPAPPERWAALGYCANPKYPQWFVRGLVEAGQ